MTENELSNKVIGCALDVHTALGPGLLESVYRECLFYKLRKESIFVEKEKPLPVIYEDVKLDCGFRIDLLVENKLIVEIKSVKAFDNIHLAQILTYLRLGKCKLGLLINFNAKLLKDGIKRVVNDFR
jgi:GxxExxY protein